MGTVKGDKTPDVEGGNQEVVFSPHLSLTHNELQGGAANRRNVSLLMKNKQDLTEEQIKLLKSVVGVEVDLEKQSSEGIRKRLSAEVTEKYGTKYYQGADRKWAWVLDFNDDTVVFSNDEGLFYVEYTITEGGVELIGEAKGANEVVSYEGENGEIVLTEIISDIKKSTAILLEKATTKLNEDAKAWKAIGAQLRKGKEVMTQEQEIKKAVQEAAALEELKKAKQDLEELQKTLETLNKEKEQLQKALDEVQKAQEVEKAAKRLTRIEKCVNDKEEAQTLADSLKDLGDEAFENVVKALEVKKAAIEGSNLFSRASSPTAEDAGQETGTAQLLKAKYTSK